MMLFLIQEAIPGSHPKSPPGNSEMTIDTETLHPNIAMATANGHITHTEDTLPMNGVNGTAESTEDEDTAVTIIKPAKKKKDKSKNKKVSFNVGCNDVQEVPYEDRKGEFNGLDTEENGHVVDEDNNNKENDIEFITKFANLQKLESVIRKKSLQHEEADKVRIEAEIKRARQILQQQARRQELARLIPGEELEKLLSIVNMQDEYVVQREDRKFMTAKRGKTSFIYLAGGKSEMEEEEVRHSNDCIREEKSSATNYSETFSDTTGGLL